MSIKDCIWGHIWSVVLFTGVQCTGARVLEGLNGLSPGPVLEFDLCLHILFKKRRRLCFMTCLTKFTHRGQFSSERIGLAKFLAKMASQTMYSVHDPRFLPDFASSSASSEGEA